MDAAATDGGSGWMTADSAATDGASGVSGQTETARKTKDMRAMMGITCASTASTRHISLGADREVRCEVTVQSRRDQTIGRKGPTAVDILGQRTK